MPHEEQLSPAATVSELTRRDFMTAAVGTGFAAAVMPVAAQTVIHTDTHGLVAGPVTVPVGEFHMPAYRAAPQGKRNPPVMLVVSEIFGVHEHIADICRRFAKQGYMAIAPELFVRQGDVKAYPDMGKLMSEVIAKVPDAQVLGDLDATVAWAKAQGGDTTKLGVTGFCWGGRIVWLYSAHNPGVGAGVAWYGRLVGNATPLQPQQPIDIAAKLHAPVLGLYGGQDTGIPPATVEKMKSALAQGSAASRASQIIVYPDAGHAFNADYRPSYRRDDALDAWQRCLNWFKQHEVA
jgi:carboxymethylenebutenolidase